jgi:hypothetical protein
MSVSAYAERLFFRLLVKTDDYGLFDADLTIVRSRCFERGTNSIKLEDVQKWLEELARPAMGEKRGMIGFYMVDNKVYGKIISMNKHHKKRSKYSRYPTPPQNILYSRFEDIVEHAQIGAQEPKQSTRKYPEKPKKVNNRYLIENDSPKPFECADKLRKIHIENNPNHVLKKFTEKSWRKSDKRYQFAVSFDRCNRLDKRSWERIDKVLSWLIRSEFWMQNIRSGKKFRDHFDRLETEMRKNRGKQAIKNADVDPNDPSWDVGLA